MSLLGRTSPLHVYAPAAMMDLIRIMQDVAESEFCYPFHFHPLPEGDAVLVDNDTFSVKCFPTNHRIACHGFLIERKTKGRKLNPDKAKEYEIPAFFYDRLKQGEDYTRKDGLLVKNEWVTEEGPSPKTYAYCADTLFTDAFLHHVKDVDAMYHEATYLHADAAKAEMRFHSTAKQAAEMAKMANAKQLLLGHYSSKYKDIEPFREEAAGIFPNVVATIEGAAYEI